MVNNKWRVTVLCAEEPFVLKRSATAFILYAKSHLCAHLQTSIHSHPIAAFMCQLPGFRARGSSQIPSYLLLALEGLMKLRWQALEHVRPLLPWGNVSGLARVLQSLQKVHCWFIAIQSNFPLLKTSAQAQQMSWMPVPGSVQGHIGGRFEQPGLVECIPCPCQGSCKLMTFKILSKQCL